MHSFFYRFLPFDRLRANGMDKCFQRFLCIESKLFYFNFYRLVTGPVRPGKPCFIISSV